MIKIGQNNIMTVSRLVDFGSYLTDGTDTEILLPRRYMPENTSAGDKIDVFIYRDNEGRLIATTEKPYARVGEFAYLKVKQINRIGAFLDWGLTKELLVPFREQKTRMREDSTYLVYVYLDNTTQRIVASAKVEKFIGNVLPHYDPGDRVKALVTEHVDGLGYRCIVDNLHYGMIYENELNVTLNLQQTVDAFVRHVREDGKIDLTAAGNARSREREIASRILSRLRSAHGQYLAVDDHSSPEEIREMFDCSKKDFKKALGHLYSHRNIVFCNGGIRITNASARRQ